MAEMLLSSETSVIIPNKTTMFNIDVEDGEVTTWCTSFIVLERPVWKFDSVPGHFLTFSDIPSLTRCPFVAEFSSIGDAVILAIMSTDDGVFLTGLPVDTLT